MPIPVIVILGFVGAIVGLAILIALIGPVFRGIGWAVRGLFWLIAHVARFIYSMIADTLRFVGALIAALLLIPFVLVNVLIARWSAAAHFGRSLQRELGAGGAALYRIAIGNPARLLLLNAVTEGIERRIPEAIAQAPGSDKPSKTTGTFPGYKVVGSLKAGGSGGRLFVAEPLPEKKAALARAGVATVDQVVIKAFSVRDGATLDQIVRESRALEAARGLGLILDHELNSERFYYITPYVPGENLSIVTQDLHARAGDRGLRGETLREALSYGNELLRTLDRYHRAGLWHKDIKPDNIIVHAGRAHLVDLGLVTPLASGMTLTTHGTEYFRDPEMVRMALRGVKVHEVDGVKFDIYGVGAVLYSVVENSFPAHGGLSQISKGCPESLRWIIRRSMTDLAHRYPSARAMLADLDHVAKATDPFAVKPAELPSMREGEVEMPEPVREPEFAAMPASFAKESPRATSPIPPSPQGAAAGAVPTGAHAGSRPRIRVIDWWTGRYDVADIATREGRNRVRAEVNQAVAATVSAVNRVQHSGRSAREQVKAARGRAARRRKDARTRIAHRSPRFSAGPNPGVGLAVVAFLGVIGFLVVRSASQSSSPHPVTTTGAPHDAQLFVRMHVVTPRGVWEVEGSGDADMLVIDEDQPIMRTLLTSPDGEDMEFAAAPAAFLPRLLAGPMGTGRVGMLWDRASMDRDSLTTLHAIADLLEDGGATLIGYDDKEDDLDAAARMRSIIGVSSVDDSSVWSSLRNWMATEDVTSVVVVERDAPWMVVDPTGMNLAEASDNAEVLPPPPAPRAPDPMEAPPAPKPVSAPI